MATSADTLVLGPIDRADRDRDTTEAEVPSSPASFDTTQRDGVRTVKRGFRWVEAWQTWVPDATRDVVETVPLEPLGMGPLLPETHRCNSLDCIECWNAGVRYADYLKAHKLENW